MRHVRALVVVALTALGIGIWGSAASDERGLEPGAPACPVTQHVVVPAPHAGSDAPASAVAPWVPDPALVPGDADGRHARYQQWIAPGVVPGVVSVTSLRFRLDAAAPLADVAGDLTYAVEVAAGPGPLLAGDLSPVLEENAGPLHRVFGGTVTIAGTGEGAPPPPPPPPPADDVVVAGVPVAASEDTVEIVFETPVLFDPAAGGLLLDVKIQGLFGDALAIALDAATDPGSTALYTPDEIGQPVATLLPAAPVLILQYVEGEVRNDVAQVCLQSLPLVGSARARLTRVLDGTVRAAGRDDLRAVGRRLEAYRSIVERLAARGEIAPEVAADLHALGADEAFAYGGGLGLLRTLIGVVVRAELGTALFAVERISTPFLPSGRRGRELRAQAQAVDAAVDAAFADAGSGVMATSDHQEMYDELCALVEQARKDKSVDEDLLKTYEDLKKLAEDRDLLVAALEALVAIVEDGRLDKDDVEDIEELKAGLKELRKKISKDGDIGKGIDQALRLLCSLAALLDSGKLKSLAVDVVDGKLVVTFDVKDDTEIEIRLLELLDLDTMSDYGKTNIYFDLHVKKDATITFCPDGKDKFGNDQVKIMFDPADGIDLDLDSSGIWVVHVLEDALGIPDLDQLCLGEIRMECGMMIFEGKSAGKAVKITGDTAEAAKKNPKKSGVTVEVEGKQTFPKK